MDETRRDVEYKLIQARALIKDKRYGQARAILKTIADQPRAQDWLAKLDRLDPEPTKPSEKKYPPPPSITFFVLTLVLLAVIIVGLVLLVHFATV